MLSFLFCTSLLLASSVLVDDAEHGYTRDVTGRGGHAIVNAAGMVQRVERKRMHQKKAAPIEKDTPYSESNRVLPIEKATPYAESDWEYALHTARSLPLNSSSQIPISELVANVVPRQQELTSLGKASKMNGIVGSHQGQFPGIVPANRNVDDFRNESLRDWKPLPMKGEGAKNAVSKGTEGIKEVDQSLNDKQMPKSSQPGGQVQSSSNVKVGEDELPAAEGAVVVVQSWVLFHILHEYASFFSRPMDRGSIAVQHALADALDVCRPAVRITDSRAFDIGNFERVLMQFGTHGTLQRREASQPPPRYAEVFKLIEVRLSFNLLIFPTMGHNASQISDRIDHLQSFASFADLDLLIGSALRDIGVGNGAGLDDVGEGEIHHASDDGPFARITADEVADCLAEDELRLARHHHHIVMVLCFALLALITCAGVALFTAQRSMVVRNRLHALPSSLMFNTRD